MLQTNKCEQITARILVHNGHGQPPIAMGCTPCAPTGKYGIMLVQDLIVNSLWLMSLVTAGSDLSLTLGYSLGTHCSIVRYDCFEFLR